jgi:hypothetical protein
LNPGLDVQLLEVTPDGWAHVLCSNGWSAWVVASQLRSGRRGFLDDLTRMPAVRVSPVALAGAALVLAGSFLPWLRAGGSDANAWDISLKSILGGELTDSGVKAGVMLVPVVLVALPLLTNRAVTGWVNVVAGGLASNIGACGLILTRRFEPSLGIGVGLVMCLLGGAAMAVECMVALRKATKT